MTARSKTEETAFTDYAEFWHHNIDKIDEINQFIEKGLARLERQYADFQEVYDEIIARIDTLAAIYSNYNSLPGREYLLRLKALMRDYEKRYALEGVDFNAIHFLHARIIELKNRQFESFPAIAHEPEAAIPPPAPSAPARDIATYPYRWITFEHGLTWYIARFDEVRVLAARKLAGVERAGSRYRAILGTDTSLITDNAAPAPPLDETIPRFFLVISHNGSERCLAADAAGKRILARRDIISPRLTPLTDAPRSPRYVRIFGRKHFPV